MADVTKPYVLKPPTKGRAKPFWQSDTVDGVVQRRQVMPGEVVHLTETQAKAFADRVESSADAAKRAAREAEVETLRREHATLTQQLDASRKETERLQKELADGKKK